MKTKNHKCVFNRQGKCTECIRERLEARDNWKCAYDGTVKKLADGRCAACGRASLAESERDAVAWDKSVKIHTPPPWVARKNADESGTVIYKNGNALGMFDKDADAAFAVRAVNSHEELLQALITALQCFLDGRGDVTFVIDLMKKAIAKAEGK